MTETEAGKPGSTLDAYLAEESILDNGGQRGNN